MSDTVHDSQEALPLASHRVLETLEETYQHDLADLQQRLQRALRDFPALAGETVTLARDRPQEDRKAGAWSWSRIVFIPEEQYISNVTLYHELGHLAIQARVEDGEEHPTTSEEYCSIFSMARMPPHLVDEQHVPYLDEPVVAKTELSEICRRALAYREDNHDYIQQCNRWLTQEGSS